MQKNDDVLVRIGERRESLSAKQQKLADFILANYKTAAFQNSTKLARMAGVSGSTVIRFAEELGYDGFPGLQSALHRILQREINTVDMFLSADEAGENGTEEKQGKKGGFFQPCIDSLHKAEKSIDEAQVLQAAKLLSRARNVYIVGFQASAFLAEYMSYFLSRIRRNVFRISGWGNSLFPLLPEEGWSEDAALIFTFPRFPAMSYALAQFFHEKGVPLVCVTSIPANRIAELSEISIGVDIEYRTYVDHMTPALYVAEAIAKKVAKLSPETSVRQLELFESFTKGTHVFTS